MKTFEKQPNEVVDIDFKFDAWLAARAGVSLTTFTVATDNPGLTIVSSTLTAGVVKVIVSGGANGETYKLTVVMSTNTPLVREADCKIKVKEQ